MNTVELLRNMVDVICRRLIPDREHVTHKWVVQQAVRDSRFIDVFIDVFIDTIHRDDPDVPEEHRHPLPFGDGYVAVEVAWLSILRTYADRLAEQPETCRKVMEDSIESVLGKAKWDTGRLTAVSPAFVVVDDAYEYADSGTGRI